MSFVYVLQNKRGMTYVGVSGSPMIRLKQHNSAAPSLSRHYTNRNRPWVIAAVVDGFKTRAQALRAEYMIKHQPSLIRHKTAIVSRIATTCATCARLLKQDPKFRSVKALLVVVWNKTIYQRVCNNLDSNDKHVSIQYLG
jgi:predicted GIY-YIG superfamily endonuclease